MLLFFFQLKDFEEPTNYFVFSRLVAFKITDHFFEKNCPRDGLYFCAHRDQVFSIWGQAQGSQVLPGINILESVVKVNQEVLTSRLLWSYFFKSCYQVSLLTWLACRKSLDETKIKTLIYYLMAYTLNSTAIGFLSEPLGRYNNRLIWGFFFLMLIYFMDALKSRCKVSKDH